MRYTQLRSFHLVAGSGGFNAAADAFHISQPTLTAQVGALEEEFGVELFVKRGRRRELSDTGRQLLAITTRLFAEEAEVLAFLTETRELRTGRLSISAVGPFHVTEMLAAFNQPLLETHWGLGGLRLNLAAKAALFVLLAPLAWRAVPGHWLRLTPTKAE